MEQSILKSTKKLLGIRDDDTSFDLDIITHINTAFSTLTDLGVGPSNGFVIEDEDEEWDTYFTDVPDDPEDPEHKIKLSKVRACIHLRARLLFDPPTSSYLLDAIKEQLREQEWRLNVNREAFAWTDPAPPVPVDEDAVGFGL